jgi:hypothetical protein
VAALKTIVRRALERRGYVVARASEALLVPRLPPGPPVSACAGVDWNEGFAESFVDVLREYRAEGASFPAEPSGRDAYHHRNPYFSLADAAVCYAFVRWRRPSVIVEVGSGYSSRVIRGALERNGRGTLVSIDPQPRADVSRVAHEVRPVPVQTLPVRFFADLPSDALLFIDSSHRAGSGSDVNFLFLEVLPALAPGVLVHVHDVYLPEDYPASWNGDAGYTEQYLLQALLHRSPAFRVLWPGRRLARERAALLAPLFPDATLLGLHCSFWMERSAP